jgi:hypothetical protein
LGAWLLVYVTTNNAGGLSEGLLASVFGEDTVYAPDYTEKHFIALRLGADEDTVQQLLGGPITKHNRRSGGSYWVYSQSLRSRNYRVRQIRFENGRVVEKLASYYWD